jgi:nicotinate phosphoribosyltransferase
MLDDDLYKFTMQCAILDLFPSATAKYKFTNRGKQRFNKDFKEALIDQIYGFKDLKLTLDEYAWLKDRCPYMKPWYYDYLLNYRYQPEEVEVSLSDDNNLVIDIDGKWCETVLWEVKLMAVISQLYFQMIDHNWNMDGQEKLAKTKAETLTNNGCNYTDFGTRRRRNAYTQEIVVKTMKPYSGFMGTSNVKLAHNYDVKPIGSYAHEWVMGNAVLESLQHPDYYAMNNWSKVFGAQLGIALTDTYGFDAFLKNFNIRFAKLFDGIRHDSGDEYEYTDKAIAHYKKLSINPLYKFIIYSNALDVHKCVELKKYCEGKINCSDGVGTKLTNDFEDSPALNMVIKLAEINGIPTVKLSDDKGKEMGDKDAVRVMKWIHKSEKLD